MAARLNNISNIVRVFMFRQRLACTHNTLRDSELAEWRSASGRRQKKKKKTEGRALTALGLWPRG